MRNRWVKIALTAAAALIVVVALVPFFINADAFRPEIESRLSSALGRKVALGHMSFSLFSGSLVAQNIAIADDPRYGSDPFIQAKSLRVGVEVSALLFSHQVRITTCTIDSPAIQLIHSQTGAWNFSSIGGDAASQSASSGSPTQLTIGEFTLKNGSVTVSSSPATGKPFVYSKVDLSLKQFSFAKSFPFDLSANLPGDGSLSLSGTAGPLAQKDAADTPFHATLRLKHFDPVAAGVVDANQGIQMVADVDSQLASDGRTASSTGKIQASKLQLALGGSPSPQPVDMDYSLQHNLDARTGQVSDMSIHAGNVAVHVTGGYRLTPQAVVLDLKLAAPSLPVDQLKQLLPAAGVRLPSGSSLAGGTLTANLSITGAATATTTTGPVQIDNTELTGFNLGSRIQGMNPLGGSNGNTRIQTLRANLDASPQTTRLANIYADIPQIGTATGNGSVSPAGALDFNLVAKLSTSSGVGAVVSQASNSLGGLFGKVVHSTVSNGVPLTITGTTANPTIRANMGAMLR